MQVASEESYRTGEGVEKVAWGQAVKGKPEAINVFCLCR